MHCIKEPLFKATPPDLLPMEEGLLAVVFFFLFLSFLFLLRRFIGGRNGGLKPPPSPPKLPIIGNLHQLGKLPHHSMRALSDEYGPLMLLHLGGTPILVVSSAETARDMLKTHDIVFADRSRYTAADIFSYGGKDIGFAPYGEFWRQAKKFCVLELLSVKRVQSFQFVREEETAILIDKVRCACRGGDSVNLSEMLTATSNTVTSRCVLGRKAEEEAGKRKFGELTRKLMEQFAAFSFGDMYSGWGWMDYITGLVPKLKATSRELSDLLDKVIEEHRIENDDFDKNDFVYSLLRLQETDRFGISLTQDNIKGILTDMFVAGTDTSSATLVWAMAELLRNQNIMRNAQEEVRRIVGKKSKVEAGDIEQMQYLKCIIKETLRLHPPAPLLLPRETSESVEWGGYKIPPKTRVLINAFAIQTDPKIWENPEVFSPERFKNNPIDLKGQDFHFLPFGGGRRSCPGITFSVVLMELLMANLLYWFDWKLPNDASGEDLDMTESFGLVVHKKFPLFAVPSLINQ